MSGAASTIDTSTIPARTSTLVGPREVAREPRDVRLAARDAAEEEAHEAHRDAERHGRDRGDDEERQRGPRRGR